MWTEVHCIHEIMLYYIDWIMLHDLNDAIRVKLCYISEITLHKQITLY